MDWSQKHTLLKVNHKTVEPVFREISSMSYTVITIPIRTGLPSSVLRTTFMSNITVFIY